MRVVDELNDMQVFYVNIGGGEPTIRRDFFDLIEYAVDRQVGVKFSTNGSFIDAAKARRLAALDYVDIQISLDGADAATNDAVRGEGSYAAARRAMDHLAAAGFGPFKISVILTRHNVEQLDELEALAAPMALSSGSPDSGRRVGAPTSWHQLHPTADQQRRLYHWLIERPDVLTGDSFFHLNALGEALPGLNLCGAGRVVCLIDPVGDVYACPFVIHDQFKAGSVRDAGGFPAVWRTSELFLSLREPQSARGLRLVRQLRRLPGRLHGGQVLHRPAARRTRSRVRDGPRRGRAGGRGNRPRARASTTPGRWRWRCCRGGEAARTDRARSPHRPQPHPVRPARDQPGRRPRHRDRHVAYYGAAPPAGPGIIVTEEASVHPFDWPYERAPLATDCADGWSRVAAAAHDEGALALAAHRARRRAGLVGLQPAGAVGAVAACPRSPAARFQSGWRPATSPR